MFFVLGSGAPIPIDSIIKKPIISNVSLSLDGEFAAAIYSNEKDRQLLMTKNIRTGEEFTLKERNNGDIYNYMWASNNKIIYNVSKKKLYHLHMGVIDRSLRKKKIFCFSDVGWPVDGLLNDSNHVLIMKRHGSSYITMGKFNIETLKHKKIEYGIKGLLIHCVADFSGQPRIIGLYQKGTSGEFSFFYKDSKNSSWSPINSIYEDFIIYQPASIKDRILVSAHKSGENTNSLYLYNVKKDILETNLYTDSVFDVNCNLHFFPNVNEPKNRTKLKGLTYDADIPKSYWFDDTLESIQKQIDAMRPHSANLITGSDKTLSLFLVSSYSDKEPEEYYCYNKHSQRLKSIFKSRPWINSDLMSPMKPIIFRTGDYLELHGYLTEPKNGLAPYPTIILIHGGPWARDYWGFNSEVQVLASRGYAVLQLNYRGSTGFGNDISRKHKFSFKEMHDDITDATYYLIEKKIADPKRIAIMGGSFGGYLSICGVAFEPDLYCCAISNAGVFDWRKHVRSKFGKYNNFVYDFYKSNLGEGDQKQYLEEISPINAAKNIIVPVLVCGGTSDNNVKISQSVKLLAAMRRAGVKVERFLKAGEGHGFKYQKNQIKYYNKIFEFLEQHMNSKK
jgi:acetyl esterase/lipase